MEKTISTAKRNGKYKIDKNLNCFLEWCKWLPYKTKNISRYIYYQLKNGNINISADTCKRISSDYGVSLDSIFNLKIIELDTSSLRYKYALYLFDIKNFNSTLCVEIEKALADAELDMFLVDKAIAEKYFGEGYINKRLCKNLPRNIEMSIKMSSLSKDILATDIGCSKDRFSKFSLYYHLPRIDFLLKFCYATNCSLDYLLDTAYQYRMIKNEELRKIFVTISHLKDKELEILIENVRILIAHSSIKWKEFRRV